MKITDLSPVNQSLIPGGLRVNTEEEAPKGFGQILTELLQQTNRELQNADKITQDYIVGKNVELHQVMLAVEQADLALQLTIQIRNKIVEAYQEIMRMQV